MCWCLCTTALAAEDNATAPPANRTAELEFFEKKVRPLFHEKCGKCHAKDKAAESGELLLSTGAGIAKGGGRGKAVVPGQPDESLLIRAVRYKDTDLQMPPEGKMADSEIATLVDWVRRGAVAPENDGEGGATGRVIDIAAGKTFWSFQPLHAVAAPAVSRGDWCRTTVDRFLLARLEAAGLSPSPEADRRTLVRRVTFDLTSLPPDPDDVEAFIADTRPDAYEQLVERLLASPRYGERAARAWLDLARYTDVAASWENTTQNAWLYRDWVVRALNEDRPYDDFVRRQLAADVMADSPPADFAALGFLGLSPNYWKELQLAPALIQNIVADEWDERIDAVSRTFLGLTVACARCHDHKFDPITTRDYYALAGVFASSQLAERPMMPEPQAATVRAARGQIAAWDAELKKIKEKESPEAKQLTAKIDELKQKTPGIDEPWAHVVEEASVYVVPDGENRTKLDIHRGESRDVPIFRRGSSTNVGEVVARRFPAVLSPGEPKAFSRGSGRAELAEAVMTDARGLAARVMVNRVWSQHFGQGLVRTQSDFGSQGERPTHPELLEDLAFRFSQDWSLKRLHRELVLSAAYRQQSVVETPSGSAANAAAANPLTVDPDNRLLWRMNRRRLEVEGWRDGLLAASGRLDGRMGGPSVPLDAATNVRRTLYGQVGRYEQTVLLKLYDFPEPTAHSPSRSPTTTPLQQLYVLNGPFLEQCAASLSARALSAAGDDGQRIGAVYRWMFQRPPTPREQVLGQKFLALSTASGAGPDEAWRLYAQSLLGLNEMMFVD